MMIEVAFFFINTALFLVAIIGAAVADPCPSGPLIGQVTHVFDGDTIALGDTRIRLQGISAPELGEPGGLDSKAVMEWLVGDQTLTCRLTGERSHDRCIATCQDQAGEDLGWQIVSNGGARDCPRFSRWRYELAEEEAAAAGYTISQTHLLPGYCR